MSDQPAIDVRIEVLPAYRDPDYLGCAFTAEQIAEGAHRTYVGGHWDRIGKLQLDYLVEQGLRPEHRLLDVGCGSLRGGRHLVDHLAPGNYYGIDINLAALEAGYLHELTDAQRGRLPASNLRATDRFDADFGVRFDVAIAQSVFTHLNLNNIRLCLHRVANVMEPGGRFFATFLEASRRRPLDMVVGARVVDGKMVGGKYSERNAYWYYRSDLKWAAGFSPWRFRYIGRWGHPRRQTMVEYVRTDGT